ncbi:MAG TPA: VOC family protein [Burkholderiales bacterium]|jgi:hypothetical protein|nr:VOC family protein [Burkholderiales bacterium]
MRKDWSSINSLRIARPVTDLSKSTTMYCKGLGLDILASFKDHSGFDGVVLGLEGLPYHFEMTYCNYHQVPPSPTPEDLFVLYIPDPNEWQYRCNSLLESGFIMVESFNPYWSKCGKTFQDCDGYRIVLQNSKWQ